MRLTDLLDESRIVFVEASASRTALLRQALNQVAAREGLSAAEPLVTALMERERLCSTAVGGGYAIPHVFAPSIPRLMVVLAVASQGVDFKSLDGRPVHFLFIILGPRQTQKHHLGLLGRLSRILNDAALLGELRTADQNKSQLLDCLRRKEDEYERRFASRHAS